MLFGMNVVEDWTIRWTVSATSSHVADCKPPRRSRRSKASRLTSMGDINNGAQLDTATHTTLVDESLNAGLAGVPVGSAHAYGSEGCRFESCRVHSRPEAPRRNPGGLSRCPYSSEVQQPCQPVPPIASESLPIASRTSSSAASA